MQALEGDQQAREQADGHRRNRLLAVGGVAAAFWLLAAPVLFFHRHSTRQQLTQDCAGGQPPALPPPPPTPPRQGGNTAREQGRASEQGRTSAAPRQGDLHGDICGRLHDGLALVGTAAALLAWLVVGLNGRSGRNGGH